MIETIKKVNDLTYIEELYPRKEISSSKVNEYAEVLENLPPITVNQDNKILDGVHRWFAYKKNKIDEIKVIVIETIDDDDILLKSTELNASHGHQLSNKEKKNRIVQLYKKLLDNKDNKLSYDIERLKKCYSIPASTFSNWTADTNKQLEEQLLEKILDLHLQCYDQKYIANKLGFKSHSSVSDKITKFEDILNDLSENSESKYTIEYPNFTEKIKKMSEFTPKLYNIWNFPRNNNETSHFGNVPVEATENLLYAYTNPFDVIFDPFGGGGATIDACKKWFRKYYVSDIQPTELTLQKGVRIHDITTGLPKDLPNPKLVFLDPPYWKQATGHYTDKPNDLSNMELDKFYEVFKVLFKQLRKVIVDDGYLVFIIQNTQWNNDKKVEPHSHKMWNIAEDVGFTFETIIHVPYSTEQYNAQHVDYAKKNKIFLELNRELVVLKNDKTKK